MSSYKHHTSSGFFSDFCLPSYIGNSRYLEFIKYPPNSIVTNIWAPNILILSIMLWFAKMALFNYFIKSISKSKMDIFILSNLEILKKVLKKMCNLHIVTATYFYCILNILTDDKRSYTLVFFNKKTFICTIIGIGI